MPFTIAISPNRTPFRSNYWLWAFMVIFLGIGVSTLLDHSNFNSGLNYTID